MDVTPRPAPVAPGRPARRRNRRALLAVVIVLGAVGLVLAQGLGHATLYFYNADEAVAQRSSLGDRRFRLQGSVVGDSVTPSTDGVAFAVAYDGARVDVRHVGDPPELFQPGIPVVLEGRWDGDVFASDRMMVKHSSEYRAENPDRLADATGDGGATGVPTTTVSPSTAP